MRFIQAAFIAILFATSFAASARADYFYWEDEKTGLSLSYPDTWGMVNPSKPDEIFAVMAPSSTNDNAVCRVRVRDDRRFLIYPPHMGREVQTISYNREFWNDYLNEYDDVEVFGHFDGSGVGRGYGSFVVTGYDAVQYAPKTKRRGIASASLYFDKGYIIDCSSTAESFDKWQPQFLSFIGSIDFKKAHDELWSGDYRNFFKDGRMQFKWPGEAATMRY